MRSSPLPSGPNSQGSCAHQAELPLPRAQAQRPRARVSTAHARCCVQVTHLMHVSGTHSPRSILNLSWSAQTHSRLPPKGGGRGAPCVSACPGCSAVSHSFPGSPAAALFKRSSRRRQPWGRVPGFPAPWVCVGDMELFLSSQERWREPGQKGEAGLSRLHTAPPTLEEGPQAPDAGQDIQALLLDRSLERTRDLPQDSQQLNGRAGTRTGS